MHQSDSCALNLYLVAYEDGSRYVCACVECHDGRRKEASWRRWNKIAPQRSTELSEETPAEWVHDSAQYLPR